MKMRTGLAGIGAAVMFTLAAQAAQAQTCPIDGGNGGGIHQNELPPEGGEACQPSGGYAPLTTTAYNANSEAYTIEAEVPDGNDYLKVGEVVEVTIEFDDVIASLKASEQDAVVLAAALGVRSNQAGPKSGVVGAANMEAAPTGKLTEAEFEAVANYVYVSMQSGGRATGRSDPAPNSWVSRLEATGQAISRAWNSFTSQLPNRFETYMTHTTYYPNGAKKSETRMGARAIRQD